ncbi:hypothetical protein BJ170DRAFT_635650 [Xylariales sp. AK1849]|nr:hypothetical protein BJ170DRAFT_635650 [Xylariales sp. AK1849]
MARLNEPLVSPDGIETLRRKFLRQNRDIARTNSNQSLRIRSLENECARMLSENLELRGQILRLETELQESRAQRIADHALEIKEKLEAQLLEWGAMLSSLGHEPIPRNHSPRATKKAKIRPSLTLASSPRWRRRNTTEMEAAAQQEGRLPPLWENKPYLRETLNREEILALCSEAAETDSPDLGPPPVSRFVDEDPVKIDLPTKSLTEAQNASTVEESLSIPLSKTSPEPMPAFQKEADAPKKEEAVVNKAQAEPSICKQAHESQTASQAAKGGLKRKMREEDEKENARVIRTGGDVTSTKPPKAQTEKPSHARDRSLNRPMKVLPSAKKDARGKNAATTPSVAQRKPLGARNANEVVNSPKKAAKSPAVDEIARSKAEVKRNEQAKDRVKQKRKDETPTPIEIPASEPSGPAPVTTIEVEPEVLSAEPHLSAPDSPAPSPPREDMRDTPPPIDISSRGETSRGSRRNRTAVSYAEPSLRDKMRRPTKQLFDAVAGEGKSMRRTSHTKANEMSSVKSEEKSTGWKDLPKAVDPSVSDVAASPLAQKTSRAPPPDEDLPITVATDGKRCDSSSAVQTTESEGSAATSRLTSKLLNRRLEEIAAREAEVAKMFDGADVYEFTSSSPSNTSKHSTAEEGAKKGNGSRHGRSRRLSSVLREDLGADVAVTNGKEPTSRGSRKRASMMVHKTTSRVEQESTGRASTEDGDSSLTSSTASPGDADGLNARDRSSMRRRSMML